MGSGREGSSPSTTPAAAMAAASSSLSSAAKQGMSASSLHKLQREELLQGGTIKPPLNIDAALHTLLPSTGDNLLPISGAKTPRARTPAQSPRSMSPLHSSRAETIYPEPIVVDFQESIMRMQRNTVVPAARIEVMQEEGTAALHNSRLENSDTQRHKSPYPSGRHRSAGNSMPSVDECDLPVRVTRRSTDAMQTQEWATLERVKSPRRSKTALVDSQESSGTAPGELKSTRSASRRASRANVSLQDHQDADLGMGDTNRAAKRAHARTHTRQHHKRKVPETATMLMGPAPAPFPQESCFVERCHSETVNAYTSPYRTSGIPATGSPPVSRRDTREARSPETSTCLQFMVDIFMWKHIPQSALLFGVGCFCIMSASLIKDMQCSVISVLAHMALLYLAATFIRRTFLRGADPVPSSSTYILSEADALKLVRVLLPPLNTSLQKVGDLFSGEPSVTLKVAAGLWLLVRVGSMMNVWTFARIAYFALFTIPKCYSVYNELIRRQARSYLQLLESAWGACGHKKAVMIGAFVVVWNFSSVSTRLCGAFISLVALRAYQHVRRGEAGNGIDNPIGFTHCTPAAMKFPPPPYGAQLMAIPRTNHGQRP